MSALRIASDDWVVVCDGRKALLTVNAGDAEYINLRVVEEHESKTPATRELGTDRPGRVQQSAGGSAVGRGGSRSGIEQTDWHDEAERAFLRTIAERINRAIADGEAKRIVIAAPPRALGALRPLFSAATNTALVGALDKDYVNLPLSEIEKHLKQPR
jgi:protein required for attachment to host cells